MSTFGGLNTAYSGLVAARKGLDVVGQNIANANTAGYTRQRVETSAIGATASTGMFTNGVRIGQGVSVDGIARLGSSQLDSQVRFSAGTAGYTAVRANSLSALEGSLNEPGENGLSAKLSEFWAGWQVLANGADTSAPAALLLGTADELVTQLAQGRAAVTSEWTSVHTDLRGMVNELNSAATQVADLNERIRSTVASGGSANELLDQRGALTTTIAALTGATVRELADGTVDVLIGGNALVSGGRAHALASAGATTMAGATDPVKLTWAEPSRADTPVVVEGGEIAGALSMLSSGGPLVTAGASYDTFAADLASTVNAIYGGDGFFSGNSAATLSVVPKVGSAVRAGDTTLGMYDGSIADAIAQLGAGKAVDASGTPIESPNSAWSAFVTGIGVAAKAELQQASAASTSATSAVGRQLSNASVDLDEENVNLLMFQHAYQGAARVLTAVDEMLDTLINRTGLVGR
ncbi:flagellar hook-associated protein FlgK [Cryobacterium sp. CG_9.6]|uniref:flagellar hook-associated protein FlgK n=1 Tax=Cryobacterium sp. CG_9.6 TaxID=2760710 RepID=UPI002476E1D5|nr:flagellar hook-associated protein FlgK [Cryobacterium sp. CG_9.6]MDH6237289.1 flagellar hook-associated protein 1 FlgK [Cryobacterium sp. CG_9.6]